MTSENRSRDEMGCPPGINRGGVPYLIWDLLESWPDEWFSHKAIAFHVASRMPEASSAAIDRALWRMVEAGRIEYRIGRGPTSMADYRHRRRLRLVE